MKVNKCKKCGAFFDGISEYCPICNIKIEKAYSLMEKYIEEEEIDLSNYSSKEELLDVLSIGISEISRRDIYLGLDNKDIFKNLN